VLVATQIIGDLEIDAGYRQLAGATHPDRKEGNVPPREMCIGSGRRVAAVEVR